MSRLRIIITKHKTLLLYLIAGGLTTLVNYISFFLIRFWQGADLNLIAMLSEKSTDAAGTTVANTIAVIASVLFAYPVNKLMVFQTRCGGVGALLREALAFFASRIATILFEIAAFAFLVTLLHLPEITTKLAVTVVVIILNYVLSVTVVFRRK